ncbi:MAG: hypothetical protein HC896_08220 [Bacteroidales bacterium]|nr:hypothetical protein [Bacteroidales bacterium]
MNNKINLFVKVLSTIREFCNSEGEQFVDKQVKKLQLEKSDNIGEEFFISFEKQYPTFLTPCM